MPQYGGFISAIALLNDGLIIRRSTESDVYYYRYSFTIGEMFEIGHYNGRFPGGETEIINNMIYFHVSKIDINYDALANVLYGIDLEINELIEFSRSFVNYPFVQSYYQNGNLVSIKTVLENNIQTSYLELYNIRTDSSTLMSEFHFDRETRWGNIKLLHTTDNDILYILYDTRLSEQDEWEAKIRAYDKNMNHYRDINLDNVADYILRQRPLRFRIWGDYFFMVNASSESLIGRIEPNGEITPLHKGNLDRMLLRNIRSQANTQLLFQRESNNIVLLDTTTGAITEVALDLKDGYEILYVQTNGNNAFVSTMRYDHELSIWTYRQYLTTFPNNIANNNENSSVIITLEQTP